MGQFMLGASNLKLLMCVISFFSFRTTSKYKVNSTADSKTSEIQRVGLKEKPSPRTGVV